MHLCAAELIQQVLLLAVLLLPLLLQLLNCLSGVEGFSLGAGQVAVQAGEGLLLLLGHELGLPHLCQHLPGVLHRNSTR